MERGALAVILLLAVAMMGCISPKVTVYKTIHVEAKGNVTVNMNSGTSIEAEIEQKTDAALKAALK